jgi:uncharacterized membrane protein
MPDSSAAPAQRAKAPRARRRGVFGRPCFGGLVVALLFLFLSFTPSLLPRTWLYQGISTGLSVPVGYGIGTFLSWAIRLFVHREPRRSIKRVAWWALLVVAVVTLVLAVLLGHRWDNQVRALMGMDDVGYGSTPGALALAAFLTLVLVLVARLVRKGAGALARLIGRAVPPRPALALGWVAAALVLFVVGYGAFNGLVAYMDHSFGDVNITTPEGIVQPQSSLRSGGPGTLTPWDTLGFRGREFVGRGPTPTQLQDFNGEPALEPIRVYVGLDTAPTAEERAALAVRELERTGAFDRQVLAVMAATGTGWIEPQSADSLEYMFNGDTAEVSIQYSYLPSWISFLVDKQKARDAGTALFDAVYDHWSTLPEGERPKLLAYGLSLGSFAGQSAFRDQDDLRSRTDGALFQGTPNDSQPWRDFTDHRDAGSPEWLPVYDGGTTMRFASDPADFGNPASTWTEPHVVYMQHASDPVIWWSWNLLWGTPDWLDTPHGPDVSPVMRWYPFVTFFQVTVDQFHGISVPAGHGHNYNDTIVAAWEQLATPEGWTADTSAELQAIIDKQPIE